MTDLTLEVCCSCRRFMRDDGVIVSQVVSDREKASTRICLECTERAEIDKWPRG